MRFTIRQTVATFALALAVASPAHAAVYDYAFGTNAAGQFTTGDAAAADPGYFLLTKLTVTSFTDSRNGVVSPVALSGTTFEPGSAYNPATGAFINHSQGNTYGDFGGAFLDGQFGAANRVLVGAYSVAQGSSSLEIRAVPNTYYAIGNLAVAIAPEPASLAALAGVALVAIRRRRRA